MTPEGCPGEQLQAKVDGRGVECVGSLLQCQTEVVVGIEDTSTTDQYLSEIGIDRQSSHPIGIGKRAPGDPLRKPAW